MLRYILLVLGLAHAPLCCGADVTAATVASGGKDQGKAAAPRLNDQPQAAKGQDKEPKSNTLSGGVAAPNPKPLGDSHPPAAPTPSSYPALESAFVAQSVQTKGALSDQSAMLQNAFSAQSKQLQGSLTEARDDLKNEFLLYEGVSSMVFLVLILVLFYRTRSGRQSVQASAQEGVTSAEISQFINSANSLKTSLDSAPKSQPAPPPRLQPSLEEVCNKLTPHISKELVRLLQESENAKLKAKLTEAEEALKGVKLEYDTLSRDATPLRGDLIKARENETQLQGDLAVLRDDKSRLETQLTEALTACDNLKQEVKQERESGTKLVADKDEIQRKLDEAVAASQKLEQDLSSERSLSESQRLKINSTEQELLRLTALTHQAFETLAPSKLRGTELSPQVEALHREALAGEASAVSAWSTLASFGSAQTDPAAKDFQLQIVRRLGVVLVQYWKQKGLTEKERYEYLALWAKCLNEHADGRYNLFVPGLGAPIDKTRMVCASSATSVHEVLCWQIRNPAGVNFMLAEVT